MENLIKILITSWFWLALGMSFFWGIRSTILFTRSKIFWWKSYQFIFNFVGSFAGWFCFYVLLIRTQNNMPQFQGFGGVDIALFILSLLGLTGHLPQVIYGIVEGFAEIAKRAIDKLSK